ncbi:MAG: T9SS type A sorting domain-containing protein [Bacteroidota bacterium]
MNSKTYLISLSLLFYVFTISAQVQIGDDIDGLVANERFGRAASLSADGTRIAISSSQVNNNRGLVRIYEESGGVWTQVGSDINGESTFNAAGFSVSLSSDGTIVAIGANENDGIGSNAGHVQVYEEVAGNWTQVGSDIDGEAAFDRSGQSVSLSSDGRIVAIGAIGNDGTGFDAGHVRVYEEVGGNWIQLGGDIDAEAAGDNFGQAVSLSADGLRVAIGANRNDGIGLDRGHARVYELIAGNWTQVGTDLDGEADSDNFGVSVALSADGLRLAVGGNFNDENGINSGHVQVFEEIGGSWTQVGSDIDGEASSDAYGASISFSANGRVVAIGAPNTSGNGSRSGYVRIYQEVGGTWTQVGTDIDGEAALDFSGQSVSISSDGLRVASSSTNNDGNGNLAGHVRVFDIASVLPVELISFTGWQDSQDILLSWETASEFQNDFFEVQRSLDGRKWALIGKVDSKAENGESNELLSYNYIDRNIDQFGAIYYRLKQIDFDGQFNFSSQIVVNNPLNRNSVMLFPNPVKDDISLHMNSQVEQTVDFAIMDMSGREYHSESGLSLNRGANQFDFDISELKQGVYLLTIRFGEEQQVLRFAVDK